MCFQKTKRQKVPLICQDVCELDIKNKFDFIFIPFNSFSEITDQQKRKQAMGKILEHLTDNGDIFITLYNPAYRLRAVDGNIKCLGKYDLPDERTLIITYFNSLDSRLNLVYGIQFYEIYDSKNTLIDKRFLNISFSSIPKNEIDGLCTEFGLSVKALFGDYSFGEFNSESQFMNFLLTKQK